MDTLIKSRYPCLRCCRTTSYSLPSDPEATLHISTDLNNKRLKKKKGWSKFLKHFLKSAHQAISCLTLQISTVTFQLSVSFYYWQHYRKSKDALPTNEQTLRLLPEIGTIEHKLRVLHVVLRTPWVRLVSSRAGTHHYSRTWQVPILIP